MLENIYKRRLESCYISVILQLRANIASAMLRDCGTPRMTRITSVTMVLDLQPDGLTAGLAGHCQPNKSLQV